MVNRDFLALYANLIIMFMTNYIESLEKITQYVTYYMLSLSAQSNNEVLGIDMSIEGLRSQKYSVGIFVFLVISLILFAIIIWMYVPKKGKDAMKLGEKIMFGCIISGIFIAIAMGYLQLIDGFLL